MNAAQMRTNDGLNPVGSYLTSMFVGCLIYEKVLAQRTSIPV